MYRVCQKKTTPSHFSSCVSNFQRISNRIVLNESQINFRSYVEKIIEIVPLVSKISTVKVKIGIFEFNRLKWANFSSHDHSFSPINNPEAVLEISSVAEYFGIIFIHFLWKLKNSGFWWELSSLTTMKTTIFLFFTKSG